MNRFHQKGLKFCHFCYILFKIVFDSLQEDKGSR